MRREARSVLITGAGGYIGRQLVEALAADPQGIGLLTALDVREIPENERVAGAAHLVGDVRDPELAKLLEERDVDTVVHLAAIVTPGPVSSRELEYSVDVLGTENVISACLRAGVHKLVVTSSGAAYGYHADNPVPLRESDVLRGNPEFAYSDHKRLVEERLAACRSAHPELEQLVFRPGAILGDSVSNQITDLFHKPVVLGVRGSESAFTFVWDRDVVACLVKGVREDCAGVYNLSGGGRTTPREIARRLGKPYLALPAWLLRGALAALHPLGLSQYGPEQVMFLRYRPELDNTRLVDEFGYRPELTSDGVFERYRTARGLG